MKRRVHRLSKSVRILWLCGGVCVVVWGLWMMVRPFDFGSHPPEEGFQKVFKMPPPPGIFHLEVIGQASTTGEVWMRFEAAQVDSCLDALKRNTHLQVLELDEAYAEAWDGLYRNPYAFQIDWPDANRERSFEAYGFSSHFGGTGWSGVVLVDRARHEFFVRGGLY